MSSQVLSLILFCTQISNNLASTGGPHEISRPAVVCRLPPPGQTKESARRDGGAAACLLCTTICFYCMALDHMFLLYGPKTYVLKTYVPKTYVPKKYVPKTYVPKTYVLKTYVPKTYVPNANGAPYNGRNLLALHK